MHTENYRSLEIVNDRSNHLHDLIDYFYESHFRDNGLPRYDEMETINLLLHLRGLLEHYLEDYTDNIKVNSNRK